MSPAFSEAAAGSPRLAAQDEADRHPVDAGGMAAMQRNHTLPSLPRTITAIPSLALHEQLQDEVIHITNPPSIHLSLLSFPPDWYSLIIH